LQTSAAGQLNLVQSALVLSCIALAAACAILIGVLIKKFGGNDDEEQGERGG